ncbi:hypothetical protein THASP1DRAFT_26839 [Thamnocephalis sphaerospora]|uniref:Transmembrane protein n=1 Tax=Thamnocephalis sphaerospora TaxID=78915 RepID=A0A4P9XG64_9FUNG|nr:hypothetical protein THASP1DRAFT_26839 [Thamnocephalis sphaerospora]|eukprot:RKP04558.1 hypothetical protein THASP1DRAFT_26839 [Thamnocephalis sphaerospora]
MTISVRESIRHPTGMATLYCLAHDSLLEMLPAPFKSVVRRHSHALFTFALVLPLQLLILASIFPGSNESGFHLRHLNVALVLVGGAVLRSFVGFLIRGRIVPMDALYDYLDVDVKRQKKHK